MFERMRKKELVTKPCNKFGHGYDFYYEPCQTCSKKVECMQSTIEEGIKMQQGEKANIPLKKNTSHGYISLGTNVVKMPFSGNKAVKIDVFLDLDWLRKLFGLGLEEDKK